MISRGLGITVVTLFSVFSTSDLLSDTEEGKPSTEPTVTSQRICFFNTARYFKESICFKTKMEHLQKLYQKVQKQEEKEKERCDKLIQLVDSLPKEKQEEVLQEIVNIRYGVYIENVDFKAIETTIYREEWQRLQRAISAYAKANGYMIVLRLSQNEQAPKPSDPHSVIRAVNRTAVWHSPENDITDAIIKQLNSETKIDE